MIVMKFGGTSVQDAAAMENVCRIVAERIKQKPLVVLSACAGVTNALIHLVTAAADGDEESAVSEIGTLRDRHISIAHHLLANSQDDVVQSLESDFGELQRLVKSISVLKHLTPRTLDQCVAFGEQWSSLLLHGALKQRGIRCERVDARDVMMTDAEFTRASPLFEDTTQEIRRVLLPLILQGTVVITQGFIGKTRDGITTTLGRGGSDYSAAILGAALDVEEIQIWTDVDGILTADPSIVPDARLVQDATFSEAAELAYFGAKVLHPSTILPAIKKNIPVRVLNSQRPEIAGTLITQKSITASASVVKSIACKKGITVITVQSTRMLMSHGFLARVFEVFSRYNKSVDVVATSEVGVSMTVDDASSLDNIAGELRQFADVDVHPHRAVVCVVGEGMKNTKGIAARVFTALSKENINVEMISHGGSEINLTFVIREEETLQTVRALHKEFF
jgi:aspartate kinase